MPRFIQTYYVDYVYSQNHAHMFHKHQNVLEILYIDRGSGRYLVGKREYAVEEGDVVICNAGILHGEAPFEKHEIETYCCALDEVSLPGLPQNHLLDQQYKPVISMGKSSKHLKNMMKTLHEMNSEKSYERELLNHLAEVVFGIVQERLEEKKWSVRENKDQKKEYLVRQITEYLDQHYTSTVTLKEIGDQFFISPSTLSHVFKKETGLSPMQYVIHRRIGEAQTLLMETKLPIHTIEEQLGFGSSVHFSALFKKYVGISPKDFRKHFVEDI